MTKELFGGSDLFSYFGGGFTEADRKEESTVTKPGDNTVDITKRIKSRMLEGRQEGDSCDDACPELTEDEKEALKSDETVNESVADAIELGEKINTNKKEDSPKPVFNHTTYICYAGFSRPLNKYFDEEKLGLLSLEDVRKRLEKDYPEMSKQRTSMSFDQKKNIIVPVITGGKKGSESFYFFDTRGFFYSASQLFRNKDRFSVNYLAAKDGLYEVRENGIGVFVAPSNIVEIENWMGPSGDLTEYLQGVPAKNELDTCREGFKFKLPLIPLHLIHQLLSLFMDYADYDVEVMGVFYWDTLHREYLLDIPLQRVSKKSIDQEYTNLPHTYIKVCEIHSHNTMGAYFSRSVDDVEEIATLLYGVVGNLKQSNGRVRFDLKMRAGMAGKFINLSPSAVLEGEYEQCKDSWNMISKIPYPHSWHQHVILEGTRAVNLD